MNNPDIMQVLKDTGVYQTGHFVLSSGRHSEVYLQCAQLLQYPDKAAQVAASMAGQFSDLEIDTVIGPALGGVLIAYEVARALGVKNIFAERDKDNLMSLRRGFQLSQGEKVLVVEDVITTGGSVKEVLELIKPIGVEIVGVSSIIDRSNGRVDFGVPFYPLLTIPVVSYQKEDCPLCHQGSPMTKPGSRR